MNIQPQPRFDTNTAIETGARAPVDVSSAPQEAKPMESVETLPRFLTAASKAHPKLILHTTVEAEAKPSESGTVVTIIDDAQPHDFSDLPLSPALTTPEIGAAPVLALLSPAEPIVALTPSNPIVLNGQVNEPSGLTQLPAGWNFTGDLIADGDISLACKIVGDILCTSPSGSITLTASCVSQGTVTGRDVLLQGHHTGRVDASTGRVCIEASAQISGDMTYTHIKMNGGLHNISLNYVDGKGDAGPARDE